MPLFLFIMLIIVIIGIAIINVFALCLLNAAKVGDKMIENENEDT